MARIKAKSKSKLKGKVLKVAGFLMILGVAGVVATSLYWRPDEVQRDPDTLCLINEDPPASTTILIDQTDGFSVISKTDVETQLLKMVNGKKASKDEIIGSNEEISVFVVDGVDNAPLKSIVSICNPGDPTKADPWTQNPEMMKRNWKNRFSDPLTKLLDDLLTEDEANTSPIMESFIFVTVSKLSSYDRSKTRTKIILVSDLLQNSEALSLYRSIPDFDTFINSRVGKSLNPDLRNVSIELYILQRQTKNNLDQKKLISFWKKWLEYHGGTVFRLLLVTGMNR